MLEKTRLASLVLAVTVLGSALVAAAETSAADVRAPVAKALQSVRADLQEGDTRSAAATLKKLLPRVGNRPHEASLTYELLGHLYLAQSRTDSAIRAFDKALAQSSLDIARREQLRATVLKVMMATGNPELAERTRHWYPNLEQAPEFLQESVPGSAGNLPPDEAGWLSLAAHYEAAGNPREAAAVLALAQAKGVLAESGTRQLARLQALDGSPLTAAATLQAALKNGRVKASPENFEALAAYYERGQDLDSAATTLATARAASDTERLVTRHAEIMMRMDRLQEACELLEDWSQPASARARLLNGICAYEQARETEAVAYWRSIPASDPLYENAANWMKRVSPQG